MENSTAMYRYLLVPGRHHAITRFQIEHLKQLLARGDVAPDAEIVWAVTSANHAGTQRNPISGSRRVGMIEAVAASEGLPSEVYRITNMRERHNFAHFVLEEIRLLSKGRVALTPSNTLLVCSTQSVAAQYQALGFSVDTAEYSDNFAEQIAVRPWDVIEKMIASGNNWSNDATIANDLHPTCLEYYTRYALGDEIIEIFNDPLIGSDDGDITTTRDYSVYRQAFEDGARRKVADFSQYVQPGRILDVGSATGETLKVLSQQPELFESDFYGVEAARPLYQLAQQRKDAGEFGDTNIFFYQRNIMRSTLFHESSLNTIITMALTHEVESYLGRDELIAFLQRMYDILAPGGVYINYDVVAPNNKDQEVYALIVDTDGDNPEDLYPSIEPYELPGFLRTLSSKARFLRFIQDFRAEEGDGIAVRFEIIDDKEYAVLRYGDLCDFLAKKDYLNSWLSEMHERFCFWEYSDWLAVLREVGFTIHEGSELKTNPWLIENRFAPAATVYRRIDGALEPLAEPPATNVLLIATK